MEGVAKFLIAVACIMAILATINFLENRAVLAAIVYFTLFALPFFFLAVVVLL